LVVFLIIVNSLFLYILVLRRCGQNPEVVALDVASDDEHPEGEFTHQTVRVTVEDYGSGRPLPSYEAVQPNKDYFNSNLSLYNM
jgi:hypothetical protein